MIRILLKLKGTTIELCDKTKIKHLNLNRSAWELMIPFSSSHLTQCLPSLLLHRSDALLKENEECSWILEAEVTWEIKLVVIKVNNKHVTYLRRLNFHNQYYQYYRLQFLLIFQ